MAKKDTILAVDIGADSLKIAEFSYPASGGIILENFAFVEYGGDLKEEELLDSLTDAFKNVIAENEIKAKKVHLSISGQSAFVRFVKLPPVGEEEARIRQIVDYEARQNVPFPMDEVVWDYQLIRNTEEEEEEEDGEMEVMFVVVKSALIENITQIIEELGKETILVEVAPTSCYNAARANGIGEDECVMILNIGGRCSSLVFIDSGRFFVRTIPIAGHSITQQVVKEFGIPFADAEEMKRRHGFVALGGAYEEPDSEVSATVSKIVRNVMTRLHGEINRSINVYRSQQKGKKPMRLYLAGGSSVMAFTPRFFSEKLRIPVEYFNPFHVVSLSDSIDRENLAEVAHMFSEVIGLGLRFATVCPIEISLVPESVKKQQNVKMKVPYFYASAATLVFCLLLTFWSFSRQLKIEAKKADLAQAEVNKTDAMLRNVKSANNKLDGIRKRYEIAGKILERRNNWTTLLDELQKALPDRMWIVKMQSSVAPSGGPSPAATGGAGDTLFDLFGPTGRSNRSTQNRPTTSSKVEWVEIEGHSLYEKGVTSYLEIFKNNLVESPYFTDDKADLEQQGSDYYFIPVTGNNNVTSFKMRIKLKTAFKK